MQRNPALHSALNHWVCGCSSWPAAVKHHGLGQTPAGAGCSGNKDRHSPVSSRSRHALLLTVLVYFT